MSQKTSRGGEVQSEDSYSLNFIMLDYFLFIHVPYPKKVAGFSPSKHQDIQKRLPNMLLTVHSDNGDLVIFFQIVPRVK